ncbi:MAG TPA: WbuC family cupin fold metalloprotein, partial [Candidatus Nanoarchaeia archaeon]|nr:WbuC family cupin fold metalloprotein [Candidatus Nanoarchaeia archaeon]
FAYPYPTEPSIIAIVKKVKQKQFSINEKERAVRYGQLFQQRKADVREYLAEQQKKGKIALFGAGHMACMLLNLFNLKDYTDTIIDDSEHKRGMMMPLSHLKIQNNLSDIKTLLLTVNPNAEEKIIAKNSLFQGQVVSLCPGSSRALSQWKEKSKEVFYSAQQFPILSKRDIDVLKEKAQNTERQRSRLCTHPDENAVVHEMFIIHKRNTYIRPHKHMKKTESLHIIEGTATLIVFDNDGNITKKVMLGDYNSGYPFYYRMNSVTYHMLVITSETLAFVEAATGPFDKSEMVFPSWAPEENDKEKVELLMNKIRGAL